MSVATVTHPNFRGAARAALACHPSVFGGKSAVVAYGDAAPAGQVRWGRSCRPAASV